MSFQARLVRTLAVGNTLGECPLWRASDQTLFWTDIEEKALFSSRWPFDDVQRRSLPRRLASFAFVAGRDAELLCAFDNGLALFDLVTGALRTLSDLPDADEMKLRFNDGRVAPDGRFWVGSMVEDEAHRTHEPGGVLYRADAKGKLEAVRRGVAISNGLAWSPDGRRVHFADSPSGVIEVADIHEETGLPGPFRSFARFEGVHPDGATIDASGVYWTALWGAGKVVGIDPRGKVTAEIPVPTPDVTCPVFCGPDLNYLAVTTATADPPASELSISKEAGSLFIFETNRSGRSEVRARSHPD